MLSGEGGADFEGDADAEDSDEDINLFEEKRYDSPGWQSSSSLIYQTTR